jgi:YD repeat-containing protein
LGQAGVKGTRTTPGEPTVSFTYTPTGKYLTSTAGDGTVNYAYDSLDRLITKATPGGTLSYTYDTAGHVASIASSNSNGASVNYGGWPRSQGTAGGPGPTNPK